MGEQRHEWQLPLGARAYITSSESGQNQSLCLQVPSVEHGGKPANLPSL